jgi:CRP-like cAMP-binding protein
VEAREGQVPRRALEQAQAVSWRNLSILDPVGAAELDSNHNEVRIEIPPHSGGATHGTKEIRTTRSQDVPRESAGRDDEGLSEKATIFSQGSPADAVFYIEKGKVKVTVLSTRGKEAVVAILGSGDFFCEGCLAGQPLRMATATAMTGKPALRRAGLRYRTMYQTRHTFASLALASGEDLGWAAKQLGHASAEMIIRRYHRFIPTLTGRDGSAMIRLMRERGP